MRTREALTWGTAIGAAAAVAWGTLAERHMFTLRRVTVPLLPPGSSEIRVLHLSDLHMAEWQHRKQRWIRALKRLSPHLVVNTGDNMGHRSGLAGIKNALEVFRGVPGVFVNGSNDYFEPTTVNPFRYFTGPSKRPTRTPDLDTADLESFLEGLGWANLNNQTASLEIGGLPFEFLGVNDPHLHFDRLDVLAKAINETSTQTSDRTNPSGVDDNTSDSNGRTLRSRASLTVGVTHAPYQRILDSFVDSNAEIIFAGHTHGGQVCIPGFGALITNCDIPRRQVKGLSAWRHGDRSAWLHVSAGLGTSIYAPVRFACFPEATLVTLTSGR